MLLRCTVALLELPSSAGRRAGRRLWLLAARQAGCNIPSALGGPMAQLATRLLVVASPLLAADSERLPVPLENRASQHVNPCNVNALGLGSL